MLISNDEEAIKKITLLYCSLSSVESSCLILVILRSETYLSLGSRTIIPLFLFLIVFEIVKWCFHTTTYKKVMYLSNADFKKPTVFNSILSSVDCADIIRSIFVVSVSCLGFYVIAVLFGAQVLNNQEETLMFSMLLTNLTILPISVQFGSSNVEKFIQRVRPNNIFESVIYRNAYGALLGAWFGAFVIPLDWDRPWQVWPIPCSLGALFGYTISNGMYMMHKIVMHVREYNKKYI